MPFNSLGSKLSRATEGTRQKQRPERDEVFGSHLALRVQTGAKYPQSKCVMTVQMASLPAVWDLQ